MFKTPRFFGSTARVLLVLVTISILVPACSKNNSTPAPALPASPPAAAAPTTPVTAATSSAGSNMPPVSQASAETRTPTPAPAKTATPTLSPAETPTPSPALTPSLSPKPPPSNGGSFPAPPPPAPAPLPLPIAGTVSIGAPPRVTAGGTLVINVNIGQVTNLNSYQFDLNYDNPVIQVAGGEGLNGVTSGLIGSTEVPMDMWGFSPQGVTGKIRVLGRMSGIKSVTGQGYLAQIHFQVVGSAGQVSNLRLSNVKMFDSAQNQILFSTQDGAVTVTAP